MVRVWAYFYKLPTPIKWRSWCYVLKPSIMITCLYLNFLIHCTLWIKPLLPESWRLEVASLLGRIIMSMCGMIFQRFYLIASFSKVKFTSWFILSSFCCPTCPSFVCRLFIWIFHSLKLQSMKISSYSFWLGTWFIEKLVENKKK
jgi:hypothetical protein